MRLLKNIGTDRVIDLVLPKLKTGFQIDVVVIRSASKLAQPEACVSYFKMADCALAMKYRAGFARYVLRRLTVDFSLNPRLLGYEYRSWIKDHWVAPRGRENVALAPRYTVEAKANF